MNVSATGRVVGIYLLPVVLSLPETTQQHQSTLSERNRASYINSGSSSGAQSNRNEVFYVTELWVDPISSSSNSGNNGQQNRSQLLRIRFQCLELPSHSPHLCTKVSQWLQTIRDTGRAHPLHSTAFEYGNRVFSIGHLVHFTDLHVLDACVVVESYIQNVSQKAPLPSQPVVAPTHKPSMFLKSVTGQQEPGPLAILMYIKSNSSGSGDKGGQNLNTYVLNCTVGSSIKHLYLFPVHSATVQMQLTQHSQHHTHHTHHTQHSQHTQHTQHTQQLQQNSVLSSGTVTNPPIVLPLDMQLGGHSSLYSSEATAGPLMLNVSKLTALTGSPSLYMPHSIADLVTMTCTGSVNSNNSSSYHSNGNNTGSKNKVTSSCVFVVASICKLGDGVRLYHSAVGGHNSQQHHTCYQLVSVYNITVLIFMVCVLCCASNLKLFLRACVNYIGIPL